MKCIECGCDAVLIKRPRMPYEGINVENVFLRNVEVELCQHCGSESMVVRNIKKVHTMIALGIAMQPAKLAGDEVRFLRKALRLTATDWASRIGLTVETFSRWESGRSPAKQVEKLARIDFLTTFSKDLSIDFVLPDSLEEIMAADFAEKRDFAIMIDAEDLDARPEYRNLRSVEFAVPNSSIIEALTLNTGRLANVQLYGGGKIVTAVEPLPNGEIDDACNAFAAAA